MPSRQNGLHHCLTCGSCEIRCPQDVQFTEYVQKLRALTYADEAGHQCPHGNALQNIMRMMATGEDQQQRLGWLSEDLETEPETGEVFYWTGCAMFYDAFFADYPVATQGGNLAAVRILNALGVRPVVSPQERCCGHDLLWNGDRKNFERLAKLNTKLLADSGANVLVTSCAECLRTWKIDYEPFFEGTPPRMMHVTEFLEERLPELTLKTNGPRRVTFQDPCRLGHHLGIYDSPRRILEALPGVELTEMSRSHSSAICCAGGTWLHCDRCAKQVQVERLLEARATGAEVLVTACPKCQVHFRCAMKDPQLGNQIQIEMRDVVELVVDALALEATSAVTAPDEMATKLESTNECRSDE